MKIRPRKLYLYVLVAVLTAGLFLIAAEGTALALGPGSGESSGTAYDKASFWKTSLENLESSGVSRPMDEIYREIFKGDEAGWRKIVDDILSGRGLDLGYLFRDASRSIFDSFISHSKILGKILLIGVAIACLRVLGETIAPQGSSNVAIQAAHLALIVLAMWSFKDILAIAREAMESLRTAFFAFVPALTGLTLASGATVTAGVLHPLVFGMGSFVSIFVLDVGFPLIYTSIAVDMAGNVGGSDRVTGVAELLRQVAFLGIGVLMSCFVGVVVGQRAAAGVADGVALRTAKYVSSTFIPVAGKMVGDTMDMFFHSLFSLKSALGIAGSLVILGAVFSPLLRMLSCLFAWKIAFSVLGPLCGQEVKKSLRCMSDGITFLAVSVFVTAFVFIICLSLVSSAVRTY